ARACVSSSYFFGAGMILSLLDHALRETQADSRSPPASLDLTENPGQDQACPTEETLATA
ncbi:hypothetical protein AB0873_32390, partial [Micromonospora sp. NPDC047707]|uniref:hypothetical protein n=1 Tax=Micromonospora sp. NPDC047707 TaxID=3154498 RepID=UPI00345432FF